LERSIKALRWELLDHIRVATVEQLQCNRSAQYLLPGFPWCASGRASGAGLAGGIALRGSLLFGHLAI
jgi:hypothetical protein